MGLTAIPFAIEIDKVKRVFGSKDAELLEKIKTADLYDHYASQSEDFSFQGYQYDFGKALEDIVFRYIPPGDRKVKSSFLGLRRSKPDTGLDENIAHGYGYVLLVICDYFGTHLLPHCDGFYCGDDFEEAVCIMEEKGLKLDLSDIFEQRDLFDIPENNDFPVIHFFTKQEIDHVNEVLDRVEIDESKTEFENEDFDEVQLMLRDIRDSFRFCKEANLEMITFTH